MSMEVPENSSLWQGLANSPERIQAIIKEIVLTLQILQRRVDDLDNRLKALEADRAASPGWEIDEGA